MPEKPEREIEAIKLQQAWSKWLVTVQLAVLAAITATAIGNERPANVPAIFALSSGPHTIEVKDQSGGIWLRDLKVLEDSEVNLSAKLRKK